MLADDQRAGAERCEDKQDVIFLLSFFPLFEVRIGYHRDGDGREEYETHVKDPEPVKYEERFYDPVCSGIVHRQVDEVSDKRGGSNDIDNLMISFYRN